MRRLAFFLGVILAVGVIAAALWPDPWAAANRRAASDAERLYDLIEQPDRIGWRLSEDLALSRAVLWDDNGKRSYPPAEQFTPVPYEIGEELERELDRLLSGLDQSHWFRLDATDETLFHCRPVKAICLEYVRKDLENTLSLPSGRLLDDPAGRWRSVVLALASLAAFILAIWPQSMRDKEPDGADFQLNPERHSVTRGKLEIALTPRDLKLLILLTDRAGTVVTKDELYDAGWGRDFMPNSRALDQHIATLRRKLDPDKSRPVLIETVRGAGYKLVI